MSLIITSKKIDAKPRSKYRRSTGIVDGDSSFSFSPGSSAGTVIESSLEIASGEAIVVEKNTLGKMVYTISHGETSSAESTENEGVSLISNISLDKFGHITEVNSSDVTKSLDSRYLRKDIEDAAEEIITFLKGIQLGQKAENKINELGRAWLESLTLRSFIQFGQDFAEGITGFGGKIDEHGQAWLESLVLRSFLEVPELRYNRIEVQIGDQWSAPGGGIIESVDTGNKIITLKLEEGEIGTIALDDICMGIYHSHISDNNSTDDYDDGMGNRRFAGFFTSYFRVTEILDPDRKSRFRYELRPTSDRHPTQHHPSEFMHFVGYGNFSNSSRQTSRYATRTYTRFLKDVNNWTFDANNVAAQFGDLSNLSLWGIDMKGYSAYLNNIYMSGTIQQFETKPLRMLVTSDIGDYMASNETAVITAVVEDGYGVDVTEKMIRWEWSRDSGDQAEDAAWNITHQHWTNRAEITFSDLGANRNSTVPTVFTIKASDEIKTAEATIMI